MPKEPIVQFAVTLLVSESGDALAGEVGVVVGTERMWHEKLDREDVETTADMALRNALRRGREYLDTQAGSNGDVAPPTQPKRTRSRASSAQKDVISRGVSRSRLR